MQRAKTVVDVTDTGKLRSTTMIWIHWTRLEEIKLLSDLVRHLEHDEVSTSIKVSART